MVEMSRGRPSFRGRGRGNNAKKYHKKVDFFNPESDQTTDTTEEVKDDGLLVVTDITDEEEWDRTHKKSHKTGKVHQKKTRKPDINDWPDEPKTYMVTNKDDQYWYS